MSDDRKQILQMLADGKITADEAERLLAAIEGNPATGSDVCCTEPGSGRKPKFLCIKVQSEPGSHHRHENVDIKIPIVLLKAGVKLGSLVPESAKEKVGAHLSEKGFNIDLNRIDAAKLEAVIMALTETSIDIDSDKEKVRVFCC